MRPRAAASMSLLALLPALLMVGACTRGKRTTCSYYVKMLNDPKEVNEALGKVGELGCTQAMPRLQQLFKDGMYRQKVTRQVKFVVSKADSIVQRLESDAAREADEAIKKEMLSSAVQKRRDLVEARKIALDVLNSALRTGETAIIASSIVEEWKLPGTEATLAEVVKNPQMIKARTAAIKALAAVQEDPKPNEDLYIWLLEQNPNAQGIDAFRIAAQKLGKMRSTKSLPQIVRALFIRNQKGEEVYSVARWALARIGATAGAPLVKVLTGEDADFVAWAQQRGIPDWEWRFGPKIIQSLADLRVPEAAPAVIANLGSAIRPLENVPPDVMERWRRNQVNRIKVCMFALGAMRNDAIVDQASEIVTDPNNDIQQRLDTASSLAMMGTPKARAALFAIYKKSPKEQFRAPLLLPVALGMHADDLATYDAMVGKDKSDLVKKALEDSRVKGYREVLETCKNERDCYLKLLADAKTPSAKREKAAMMLAHLPPDHDALFAPILKAFGKAKSVYTDLKRYALLAVARNLTRADETALAAAYDGIKSNRRLAYWAEELKMLREWAGNLR